MRFSVTIPAYKAKYLAEAVESVLSQDFNDYELVIINDCSPEGVEEAIRPFISNPHVKYFRNQENFGAFNVVDNWNRCLENCSGDYIICMGDDDCLKPDCLSVLDALIIRYPGLAVYHSRTEIINGDGEVIEVLEERPEYEKAFEMLYLRWCGRRQFIGDFCFAAEHLKGNGGFYKLPLAWWADDISSYRAARECGIANTLRPVFQYRMHDETISANDNYPVKLNAMMSAWDWFSADFSVAEPRDEKENHYLDLLKGTIDRHFREYSEFYVRMDVAGNHKRALYWLGHLKESHLGFYRTAVQVLKGLL